MLLVFSILYTSLCSTLVLIEDHMCYNTFDPFFINYFIVMANRNILSETLHIMRLKFVFKRRY